MKIQHGWLDFFVCNIFVHVLVSLNTSFRNHEDQFSQHQQIYCRSLSAKILQDTNRFYQLYFFRSSLNLIGGSIMVGKSIKHTEHKQEEAYATCLTWPQRPAFSYTAHQLTSFVQVHVNSVFVRKLQNRFCLKDADCWPCRKCAFFKSFFAPDLDEKRPCRSTGLLRV